MSTIAMNNAFRPGEADLGESERSMIERRERLLGPAYRLFYDRPLHLVRGEGVWLFDDEGHRYLDAYNNVASVGHAHPHVVQAISRQAALLNTHTRYLHEGVLDFAERLLTHFPGDLSNVMFTCTGSEANDLAYRIACRASGGHGVICTSLAYHGCTQAVAAFSPSLGPDVAPAPHVRTVPAPDPYRGHGDAGDAFVDHVRAAAQSLRDAGIRPAALIVDTVFSSDGVFAEPTGFLTAAAAEIRRAGGLFIADEVQAGYGRLGSHWSGFERHGVQPDLVTMGKPMGAGHPIGAIVARPAVLEAFGRTRYFNTFGGNPVSAAAGLAVLDVIEREGLVENALDTGSLLVERLNRLAERHRLIGDVRGSGLFIGVELVLDRASREPAREAAHRVVNAMRDRHVLISSTGPLGNVLKIRPPLVFGPQHALVLAEALDEALEAEAGRA